MAYPYEVLKGLMPRGGRWQAWDGGAPRALVRMSDGRVIECYCALRFTQRLRGLIGSRPGLLAGNALLFPCCSSVHTFGMAYPIDVAMFDRQGSVTLSRRGVGAGRIVDGPGAYAVMEREASGLAWPIEGGSSRSSRFGTRAMPRCRHDRFLRDGMGIRPKAADCRGLAVRLFVECFEACRLV